LSKNESLIKANEIEAQVSAAGFNFQNEMLQLSETNRFDLPRVRIEHRSDVREISARVERCRGWLQGCGRRVQCCRCV